MMIHHISATWLNNKIAILYLGHGTKMNKAAQSHLCDQLSLGTVISGIKVCFAAVQDITFISRTSYYGN